MQTGDANDYSVGTTWRVDADDVYLLDVFRGRLECPDLRPEKASWLPDLEAELFAFPGSKRDDQCDSISQALLDKNQPFWTTVTPEQWRGIPDQARIPQPGSPAWHARGY